jgi:hypothetical protein
MAEQTTGSTEINIQEMLFKILNKLDQLEQRTEQNQIRRDEQFQNQISNFRTCANNIIVGWTEVMKNLKNFTMK